ncbi:MAG: PHP domain-containing protein [Thermoplasmata archaeon]|nr:PHP domain-containing protein [Thermoplasmata archaeon]
MSAGLRLDLHVHSEFSPDSHLPVSEIANAVGESGLDGFALTDHMSVAGHAEFVRVHNVHSRLLLLRGVEVSAREGHVLIFGVSEVPPRDLRVEEVIRWAEPRRGVVVLAHPFRWVHGVGGAVARRARVHGIEGRNGGTLRRDNARADRIAGERRVASTGGSDAHRREEVGRAYTEFPPGLRSEAELLDCLRQGSTRGGGASLSWSAKLALTAGNGFKRLGRGFRPV